MTTLVPGNLGSLADSYGGIVGAINQLRQRSGLAYKAYDASFHGIVEALKDLSALGNSDTGELPPGWGIDSEGDGQWQYPPKNGSLWFDERQGRLFVWLDDGYYQTNGNDGLTAVSETPPSVEVTGAQWYNPTTKALYIYDGTDWNLIDMTGTLSSETLLMNQITKDLLESIGGSIVSTFPETPSPTQGGFNRWAVRSLMELENGIEELYAEPAAYSNSLPPESPVEGDFWFDTSNLNLYVYYVDNDSGQWVPAFNTLNNSEFTALTNAIANLSASVAATDHQLSERIDAIPLGDFAHAADFNQAKADLDQRITNLTTTVGDLNRFASANELTNLIGGVNSRLTALETEEIDLSPYATNAGLNTVVSALHTSINTNAAEATAYADARASEVAAQIPDISGKANTADLQAFITQAAQNYFPRLGGTLNGTFGMQKADLNLPSFDFSNQHYFGQKVFKFKTYAPTDQYVEFGTNENPWEYAWEFGANEDFCWKHADAGKVFSIDEDGPACEKLTIGSFGANTPGGRYISNTVEVGERIRAYENAFTQIRNAAALSTDFESFKTRLLEAVISI